MKNRSTGGIKQGFTGDRWGDDVVGMFTETEEKQKKDGTESR